MWPVLICAHFAHKLHATGTETINLSPSLSLSIFLPPLRSNKCAKISIWTFQFWILLTCLCGRGRGRGGLVQRYLFNVEPGNRFHWFTKFTLISSWNDAPPLATPTRSGHWYGNVYGACLFASVCVCVSGRGRGSDQFV